MKYVFGPVPSRRLGQSLGIDVLPLKTCNWNCVYCQLGRTSLLVKERREYFPPEEILAEVRQALEEHAAGGIDWVTFVGSGETCLYNGLGRLIRDVKAMTGLPVAVITNGSLLYLPEVRDDLSTADAVLPSLDAGTPNLYRRINRPHPQATFERLLDGLIAFRDMYRGQLWVEVMLIKGLNDSDDSLIAIASALNRIRPDQVHIVLPTRPPAERRVQPADEESVLRAYAIFGDIAQVVRPTDGTFELNSHATLVDSILDIITRHPMSENEIEKALACWSSGEVKQGLESLAASGKAQIVERYGVRFWSAVKAKYTK